MNSAIWIPGPKLVSAHSVELCCINTEVWVGASAVISVPCCISLSRGALSICKTLLLKRMLKALLRGRAQVFPKKETPFLVKYILKCFLNGAGLGVNWTFCCRLCSWCKAWEGGGLRLWPHAGRNGSCLGHFVKVGGVGGGVKTLGFALGVTALLPQVKGFLERTEWSEKYFLYFSKCLARWFWWPSDQTVFSQTSIV